MPGTRPRGRLRVYLGAAPGVGKTYAMLDEGRRRRDRGTDVVVAVVETHGRPRTVAMAEGLETVPRRTLEHRGATFTEMDVDAVLARRPEVALVDELAHTNVPGSRSTRRWHDVLDLLDAGIDVITTVNVQHLESVNDVVERITGVAQRERVPDHVVRAADQVDLVDMSPRALRQRLAHGNVYPAGVADAALQNYFREGNLIALRELALLWVADQVDDHLQDYRARHGITDTWEARERVVVALTGGPEGETLVRRAARIAARTGGGDLLAVHVRRSDGLAVPRPTGLQHQRWLVEALGGTFHEIVGDEVPDALLDFARAENATQLVIGASTRPWWASAVVGSIGTAVVQRSGAIDVHMVTHDHVARRRLLPVPSRAMPPHRLALGLAVDLTLLPLLTWALRIDPHLLNLPGDMLLYLLVVIVAAMTGGIWPALVAALAASALLNYYFTPPLYTFTVQEPENLLALGVFVLTAVLVSTVVTVAARSAVQATRAAAEAHLLATTAGTALQAGATVEALLGQIVQALGLTRAHLREQQDGAVVVVADATAAPAPVPDQPDRRPPEAPGPEAPGPGPGPSGADASGTEAPGPRRRRPGLPAGLRHGPRRGRRPGGPGRTDGADGGERAVFTVTDRLDLVVEGPALGAGDRKVVAAVAAQAATLLERRRLSDAAARAQVRLQADALRSALLDAVSHDFRNPLASATAAVSTVRRSHALLTPDDREALLETAEESLGVLTGMVTDLLDMSRLHGGALGVERAPVALDAVVRRVVDHAVKGLGDDPREIAVDVPDTLPGVLADAGLLERVLANLVQNALRHTPHGTAVAVVGALDGPGTVLVGVVDHGPGVPPHAYGSMFAPFQRLGDAGPSTGVGLGLAVAKGLTEAMDGTLVPEPTPGGGLTMTVRLPTAPAVVAGPGPADGPGPARGHVTGGPR